MSRWKDRLLLLLDSLFVLALAVMVSAMVTVLTFLALAFWG